MNTEKTEETERMDWEGAVYAPTDKEYATAMEELLNETNLDELGRTISGVLEFLTARALQEGSFYIMTDNKEAITVFAAGEDAITVKTSLPDNITSWEDQVSEAEAKVITNRDPGDEQDDAE